MEEREFSLPVFVQGLPRALWHPSFPTTGITPAEHLSSLSLSAFPWSCRDLFQLGRSSTPSGKQLWSLLSTELILSLPRVLSFLLGSGFSIITETFRGSAYFQIGLLHPTTTKGSGLHLWGKKTLLSLFSKQNPFHFKAPFGTKVLSTGVTLCSKLFHHKAMYWSLGLMICVCDTPTADNQVNLCVPTHLSSCGTVHNYLFQELQQHGVPKSLEPV